MDFTDNREIEQIKYIESDKNQFSVMWSLTTWCNYKCPYCCQLEHDLKLRPELDVIESAKKINKIIKECHNKTIMLTLLGGEVTYYNLIKILNEFDCNITKIVLTTNFSQRLNYFKDLYEYCKSRKIWLQMLCSYHETGDDFFLKYLELTKWCVDNDNPPPTISFVMDNDFDFTIFDRFPNIPRSLINVNLKQLPHGFVKLNPEVSSKWKLITVDKYKWANNVILKPMLQKRKENNLWWYYQELGYEVVYNTGEKEPLSNLKSLLMYSPKLLYNESKACNAIYSNMVIDENDNLYMCSTYNKLLANLNNFNLDEYKKQLINENNLICPKAPCFLCHTANIYKNLKMLLDNEPLIKEKLKNEL